MTHRGRPCRVRLDGPIISRFIVADAVRCAPDTSDRRPRMTLRILRDKLHEAMQELNRVAPKRATLPVLSDVLLETVNSMLRLTATDLEVALIVDVGAQVEERLKTLVSARALADTVRTLPKGSLVTITKLQKGVHLTCGAVDVDLLPVSNENPDGFPPLPELPPKIAEIPADGLREAIDRTIVAVANEESRPVLTGMLFEFEKNELTLAAADGFRLAVETVKALEHVKDKQHILVPRFAVRTLSRLLKRNKGQVVQVHRADEKRPVGFSVGNVTIVSQQIAGSFPEWRRLIPSPSSTIVNTDVDALLASAKQAAIVAKDGSGIVRLWTDGKNERLALAAHAEESSTYTDEVLANTNGPDVKVAVNARFLIDALTVMPRGTRFALDVTTPSSPVVFRYDEHTLVLMPMFVNWADTEPRAKKPDMKPVAPPAPAPAPTKPSTKGRRTERRVTPTPVAAKETRVKGPKDKFFRRMAAFSALGVEPDRRSWKELKPVIGTAAADVQAAYEATLGKLRGQSGNAVTAVVNGGSAETPATATTKPAAKRKRAKASVQTVDVTDSIVDAMAKANGRAAA